MKRTGIVVIEVVCLLCAMVVLLASFVPDGVKPKLSALWINVGHVPAYFVFATLSASCVAVRREITLRRLLLVGAAVYAFSVTVECLQPLFGRTFSLVDLGLNAIGVTVAIAVFAVSAWFRNRTLIPVSVTGKRQ